MSKRRIYDNERHAQFLTFSCYKRRTLLQTDAAKRIVIGMLGSQLTTHKGLCLGFVIMPEHGPVVPATEIGGNSDSHA